MLEYAPRLSRAAFGVGRFAYHENDLDYQGATQFAGDSHEMSLVIGQLLTPSARAQVAMFLPNLL